MIINLDSKSRIRGTSLCWQLENLTLSKGKREWRPIGYYSTLNGAVRGAVQRQIRTAPAEGVNESIRAVDAIIADLTKALEPHVTVDTCDHLAKPTQH